MILHTMEISSRFFSAYCVVCLNEKCPLFGRQEIAGPNILKCKHCMSRHAESTRPHFHLIDLQYIHVNVQRGYGKPEIFQEVTHHFLKATLCDAAAYVSLEGT